MFSWPWWAFSIVAAVLWGLHFNLLTKVARVLPRDIYTPLTLLIITSTAILLLVPFIYQKLIINLQQLWQSDTTVQLSLLTLMLTAMLAATSLYIAMQLSPNPTIAALLDISYPIFVALTAWLLFKENHIDWSVLLGGSLIFSGVLVIVWHHG